MLLGWEPCDAGSDLGNRLCAKPKGLIMCILSGNLVIEYLAVTPSQFSGNYNRGTTDLSSILIVAP